MLFDQPLMSFLLARLLICGGVFFPTSWGQTGPTPIGYGDTLPGTIECRTMDDYVFSGATADEVIIHVIETSDFGGVCSGVAAFQFDQCVELYDDSTTLLRTACTPLETNAGTKFRTQLGPTTLQRTGVHTVRVRDANNRGRGTYAIFLQNTADPKRSDVLSEDTSILLPIQTRGEVRTFTFQAPQAAFVNLAMQMHSGTLAPRLALYDPAGKPVALPESGEINYDVVRSGRHALLAFSALDESGVADLVLSSSSNRRRALSQIVDSSGWKTTIILVNLSTEAASFAIDFWGDDGNALPIAFEGTNAAAARISGVLPANGSQTIQTSGAGQTLSQGWAELVTTQRVAVLAVFRQRVPGRPDQEAVVTTTSGSSAFVLPFDNSPGFVTSTAIVNTSPTRTADIEVTFRDQEGRQFATRMLRLPPRNHVAFALPIQFTETSGLIGTAEFETSVPDIMGLGLRFSDAGAFTSFPVGSR